MIIDLIFVIVIAAAVTKGYRNGFIVAVFSVIALFAGLAAAVKFSTVAAGWLNDSVNVSARWIPILSFILVFLAAVLLVRLVAGMIQKTAEFAMLGWLNRLAGIFLYAFLYTVIFSVALFYLNEMDLLAAASVNESRTYPYLLPWGPKVIDAVGSVLPVFKNMFRELETFFGLPPAATV